MLKEADRYGIFWSEKYISSTPKRGSLIFNWYRYFGINFDNVPILCTRYCPPLIMGNVFKLLFSMKRARSLPQALLSWVKLGKLF